MFNFRIYFYFFYSFFKFIRKDSNNTRQCKNCLQNKKKKSNTSYEKLKNLKTNLINSKIIPEKSKLFSPNLEKNIDEPEKFIKNKNSNKNS